MTDKPECFGKMDLLGTGTKCSLCDYDDECWKLSFDAGLEVGEVLE